MKKILKSTSKLIVAILLILASIATFGFVLGEYYSDEIQDYVIAEINSEIDVKVNVSSAEFSVLRKFPFVSIVLNDVVALSGNGFMRSEFVGMPSDTLFSASRIYLQFNLLDILRKEYRLRKIHAVGGSVTILVDSEGGVNYRIFKENNKKKDPKALTVGLDHVKVSGFTWQFLNLAKDIFSEGEIKDLALKGKFSQNSFSLNTLSSLYFGTFKREGIEYASKLNLSSRLILDVQDSVYTISRGDLSLNNLNIKAGGSFTTGSQTLLDLQVAGENLDIKSLVSALPFNTESIKKYAPAGKADMLIKLNGSLSSTAVPSIRAAFKVMNGSVFLPQLGSQITGIALRGTYSNGSRRSAATSRILLSDFFVNYGESSLTGKLSLDNFINPFLSASLNGTLIAKDLSSVMNIEGLILEQGFIHPDLSININLSSYSDLGMKSLSANGINGTIGFEGISGKTPFSGLPLHLLEGSINMDGKTWFPVLTIKLGENIASTNLVVDHFLEFLLHKSAIPEINGEILSERLIITDFIKKSDSSEEIDFHLPDSIYLKLHCKVDSFVYGKFLSSGLDTWFSYKPGLLSVSSLKMETMSGKVSAGGAIIEDIQGKMLLRTTGDLRKIDIHNLFHTFNNFGQDFIISENLKGFVSGTFDFSAHINNRLELQTKNLTAESDFVIENGELINFEPITELSSFVELSELQHIRFSTLKNSVLIKDETVFIPQMDINSSAFNITISGSHGFDNYFDYKMRLSLNDILAAKVKKPKRESEEFGVIEDDGAGKTNLYLTIVGTPDDFKIRYDKKEAVNKIKSDLQKEKKVLKTILREELGLFKKDTLSSPADKDSDGKDQFIMDWGDEADKPVTTADDEKEKKGKKKDPAFKISWDEEDPDLK